LIEYSPFLLIVGLLGCMSVAQFIKFIAFIDIILNL